MLTPFAPKKVWQFLSLLTSRTGDLVLEQSVSKHIRVSQAVLQTAECLPHPLRKVWQNRLRPIYLKWPCCLIQCAFNFNLPRNWEGGIITTLLNLNTPGFHAEVCSVCTASWGIGLFSSHLRHLAGTVLETSPAGDLPPLRVN